MEIEKQDVDKATTELANEIRDLLGKHIAKLSPNNYQETLTSCLIALCVEVGRLRWLVTETGEVDADKFDEVFWRGTIKHFNENKKKFESSSH